MEGVRKKHVARVIGFAAACVAIVGAAATARAQASADPDEPTVAVDLRALLEVPHFTPTQVTGTVWTVTAATPGEGRGAARSAKSGRPGGSEIMGARAPSSARPGPARFRQGGKSGRMLLLLPITITPGGTEYTLDASTVKVRGGRHVAWLLRATPAVVADNPGPGGSGFGRPASQAADGEQGPVLARKVGLDPDGTLHWKLERSLSGGTLTSNPAGYDLKVDRRRILEVKFAAGPPPSKSASGTRDREAAIAYRRAVADYKRQLGAIKSQNREAYQQWVEQVAALPDTFSRPMPVRIWAVYDMTSEASHLNVEGPGLSRWSVAMASLDQLRAVVKGQGRGEHVGIAAAFQDVVRQDDANSQRLAAMALDGSTVVEKAETGDSLYRVMAGLIESPDGEARRTMVRRLLEAEPTEAVTNLIAQAMPHMDAALKLEWLRTTLGMERTVDYRVTGVPGASGLGREAALGLPGGPMVSGSDRLRLMVPPAGAAMPTRARPGRSARRGAVDPQLAVLATNRLLEDAQGPDPADVLGQVMAYAAGTTGRRRSDSQVSEVLIEGVLFDAIPGDRVDAAVGAVVGSAGTSALAAAWLDRRLLSGASGRLLQRRTLEILAAGYLPQDRFNVGYDRFADAVFGTNGVGDQVPAVQMQWPVLLPGPGHSLFYAFQHGSSEIRALGWDALPKFSLSRQGSRSRSGREDVAGDPDIVDVLLTVAQGHDEPRYELVEFLRRQSGSVRATHGLVLIVAHGEPAMANRAAAALIGSGRDLAGYLNQSKISGAELHAFAEGIYRYRVGHAPLAVGLIRQRGRRNNVVQWFAQHVADGHVPPVGQWAGQVGQGRELLSVLQDSDKPLKFAAAGALTASVGGTDKDATELVDRASEVPAGDHDQLESTWFALREQIYGRRIAESVGSYMLTLNMYATVQTMVSPRGPRGPGPGGPGGMRPMMGMPGGYPGLALTTELPPDARRTFSKSLGVVELGIEGGEVYLGNRAVYASIPEDHLALRVDEPENLKNLVGPLGEAKLDQASAMEFQPTSDRGWRGLVPLPEGRIAELLLEWQDQ